MARKTPVKLSKAKQKLIFDAIALENHSERWVAAHICKISHQQFISWKNTTPELKALVEEAKDQQVSNVEDKLQDIIFNDKHPGQLTAVIFYLKTQGKWRTADSIAKDKQEAETESVEITDEDRAKLKKMIKLATLDGEQV